MTNEHDYLQEIETTVKNNDIVLYMKGSASLPMCGFSAVVIQILRNLAVPFIDIDVLKNANLRQAIKEYTNWPTIPQLYIKAEFIGGTDIVRQMYESGELQELLKSKGILAQ